mmetsp:Transcript_9838/g.16416  ORF Transcript_9838/g.16416 Transcript_9838/m.16416 type:complete len:86 (+) Transcript_9838:2041-2298(+)
MDGRGEGTAKKSIGHPTHQLVQLRKKGLKLHFGLNQLMGIKNNSIVVLAAACCCEKQQQMQPPSKVKTPLLLKSLKKKNINHKKS